MKKYVSRETKWYALFALICFAILIAGIVLILAGSQNIPLQIGLIISGGLLGALFLSCFFTARSRVLTIDPEKIVFPKGAAKNGRMTWRKNTVKFEDIRAINTNVYKGFWLISKDTSFSTLTLKDGTAITATFSTYGKDAEKEIVETIRQHIA